MSSASKTRRPSSASAKRSESPIHILLILNNFAKLHISFCPNDFSSHKNPNYYPSHPSIRPINRPRHHHNLINLTHQSTPSAR
jgi:hypothetical protein